jgi:hypothetical protein
MTEASGPMDENRATDEPSPLASWQLATEADLFDLDFEEPIAGLASADTSQLSAHYYLAIRRADTATARPSTPSQRVFTMLWAVTSMHLKPEDKHEPFGPLWQAASGRTAAPADFRGPRLEILMEMADRAKHPALRARLADLCWLLDRKQARLANVAIAAYVALVQEVDSGRLKFQFDRNEGALHLDACDLLRRALQIGLRIGWDNKETIAAREATILLRKRATSSRSLVPILRFGKLDLTLNVSNPAEVAADIEEALESPPPPDNASAPIIVDLWRLAANAYRFAKMQEDENRCKSEAADRLVAYAEVVEPQSAILASHTLAEAIAELHGIPGKKTRRKELRHRLVDIQAQIPEELSVFSLPLDLEMIAENAKHAMPLGAPLIEKLFVFATLARSPDPEELAKTAADETAQSLSALFPTSHHDQEGKMIYNSSSGGFSSDANSAAIRTQIAQIESIRRHVEAFGSIEAARQEICAQHFFAEDVLQGVLRHSPFVPSSSLATFCRGFLRFFQGDFVSAIYVLTPMLENSLRYVLEANGHDVTIFDDATRTQEDRTISTLFEQMRPELDEVFTRAITTDIENVFLTKPGPHIRHSLAHGLLHDAAPYGPDAIYGCWLIFRLCLLPLFPHFEQIKLAVPVF